MRIYYRLMYKAWQHRGKCPVATAVELRVGAPTVRKIDHEQKRKDIAEAVARLIAEKGVDRLTVRAIAKELDCSTGVLAHYFPGKDDMVIAALSWAHEEISAELLAILPEDMTVDVLFDLMMQMTLPMDELSDLRWRVRLQLWAYALTRPTLYEAQQQRMENWREMIAGILQLLQKNGNLRQDLDIRDTSVMLSDVIAGAGFNLLFKPLADRSEVESYLRCLIDSLRA